MKVKATAAEWTERVRAWRDSGRSAAEFVEGKAYSSKLLCWWASELARRERRKRTVHLARVTRVTDSAPRAAAPLLVAVGAARIEIRAGFDRALLREVIDALGGGK